MRTQVEQARLRRIVVSLVVVLIVALSPLARIGAPADAQGASGEADQGLPTLACLPDALTDGAVCLNTGSFCYVHPASGEITTRIADVWLSNESTQAVTATFTLDQIAPRTLEAAPGDVDRTRISGRKEGALQLSAQVAGPGLPGTIELPALAVQVWCEWPSFGECIVDPYEQHVDGRRLSIAVDNSVGVFDLVLGDAMSEQSTVRAGTVAVISVPLDDLEKLRLRYGPVGSPVARTERIWLRECSYVYDCALQNNPIPDTECEAMLEVYRGLFGTVPALRDFCTEVGRVVCRDGHVREISFLQLGCGKLCMTRPEARLSPAIGELQLLERLDINLGHGFPPVAALPDELGQLPRLISLALNNSGIRGPIPPSLGSSTALQNIFMRGNQLTGPIPESLGRLRSLTVLDLGENRLTGTVPPQLAERLTLRTLRLNDNDLAGPLPRGVFRAGVDEVDLANNQFVGDIPSDRQPIAAQILDLSHNQLTGPLPRWLAASSITRLDLQHNSLSGEIPVLGSLGVAELLLNDNQFTGVIPPSISDLRLMPPLELSWGQRPDLAPPVIDLSNNDLGGPIPPGIGQSGLRELHLAGNRLEGNLDPAVWAMGLSVLNVSDNEITGSMPQGYGDLHRLYVAGNQLSGELPSLTGGLSVLDASHNKLSGRVPASILSIPTLDLSHNDLSGRLVGANGVDELRLSGRRQSLDLSHNRLAGEFHVDASFRVEKRLNLSHNRFSGQLPTEALQVFDTDLLLNDNRFTGRIPETWVGPSPGRVLDLSNNQLSGAIPPDLARLSHFGNAGFIHLGGNQLSGAIPAEFAGLRSIDALTLTPNECLTAAADIEEWLVLNGIAPADLCVEPNVCLGHIVTVSLARGELPTSGPDVILGTPGDDVVVAGDGDDVVCGRGGDDTIWGQGGSDQVLGGAGDDVIRGAEGDDVLFGGDGSDDVHGGAGDDEVFGQAGADHMVQGGFGADFVDGGSDDDRLVAGNVGVDEVFGRSGNDKVVGGPDDDLVHGGFGDDEVKGNGGDDVLLGGPGSDQLFGGPGADVLIGPDPGDACNGGANEPGTADVAVKCGTRIGIP